VGDAWRGYVPLRVSDTVCVQDRLPPGAAAVLINQTHTCKDLLMPLDALEKRLFDAIDGIRSVQEIVDSAWSSSQQRLYPDLARNFYEQLWWHDQVVFDASVSRQDVH